MSQENVEVVRAFFEAWNAEDMDAVRELYDPAVIVRAPKGWPEEEPLVGRDATMRGFERLRATWDGDTLQPVSDFFDVGDRVAIRASWRGEGRGPASSVETTHVYTVRQAKIVNQEFFWDHAEALEAVGISEQDAHAES